MRGLLAGMLLLCSLSMFMACGSKNKQPGERLTVYLEALKAGDYTGYSQGLTGLQVADTLTDGALVTNLMKVYEKFLEEKYQGLQDFQIIADSLTEDGLRAIVRVKLKFGNGQEEETEYEMIQEEEDWKINLAS